VPHLATLSPLLIAFAATTLSGFVIGLELHSYRRAAGEGLGYGTTRTLTLLAVFGFVLALLDPDLRLYAVGLLIVGGFIAISYWHRQREGRKRLLTHLVGLLVYAIGPLALKGPLWLPVLYVVVILLMLGEKPGIRRLSDAFRSTEAVTLAKFLIMAGLILPLLPDSQIASFVTVTWYQLWLAVLVVSGISYISYIAQAYFFPARGILLTGALGGLYSSTATTVVLGKRIREAPDEGRLSAAAIVLATLMMYLRLWALIALLGHGATALRLALPFGILALSSGVVVWLLLRGSQRSAADHNEAPPHHPLEFSTALLFAVLFVLFAAITHFVITDYGARGLHVLSFAVGFTDIDPFILSLLDGKFPIGETALMVAVVIASGSNNLLKAGYALALGRNRAVIPAAAWLAATFAISIGYAYLTST
jgi:uncharacterized membrane protein (DUF4010 family)